MGAGRERAERERERGEEMASDHRRHRAHLSSINIYIDIIINNK